jgi:CheY-like chemotaxis protein
MRVRLGDTGGHRSHGRHVEPAADGRFASRAGAAAGNPAGSAPQNQEASVTTGKRAGGTTILLVEDEPMVREVIRDILRLAGHSVLAASGPEEALDLCRDHPGPIHLLMTDVVLPGTNGLKLAHQVQTLRAEARVLFASGHDEQVLLQHGVLLGRTPLLRKPFTLAALDAAIGAALEAGPVPTSRAA